VELVTERKAEGQPGGARRAGPRGDLRTALERLAPKGSRARAALVVAAKSSREARTYAGRARWRWRVARGPAAAEPSYEDWLSRHRLDAEQLQEQRGRVRDAAIGIKVDCVVLGDGPEAARTLSSLKGQTLGNWSAKVASGGAGALPDRRIRRGGSEAALLEEVPGDGDPRDFVLVLKAGDIAEPDLLFNIAAHGWDDPSVELVHFDDDLIDAAGEVSDPRFRPSWSPDMLLSANYLGRSFAVRRQRLAAAGGFSVDRGEELWWELLLRLGLSAAEVARVPRVLLHVGDRPRVEPQRAVEMIGEHLRREGRQARVEQAGGAVRVNWELDAPPKATVVIPTRSRETLLARCLDGLARTDYPDFEVIVVDSGERSAEAERWYASRDPQLGLKTVWWQGPFNYSAANNAGARAGEGELIVFLNDDIDLPDPSWLRELAGWASQPGIGLAGLQMTAADGTIQHGGVVLGVNGFAEHLFAGLAPGSDSLLGSTTWYRNCLSVTAACVALERSLFERIGGFDERFLLCGSDVVLGLDARFHGQRNVCSPHGGVRHLEAATRGESVPVEDVFTSYWRYQRWLRAGDPYFSPNLSRESPEPRLSSPSDPDPMQVVGTILRREFTVFRQRSDEKESRFLASACRADRSLEERVRRDNAAAPAAEIRTVNWFLPDIDNPFYGGINTALRLAANLTDRHGVQNQFILLADPNEHFARSALEAAFPVLADSRIAFSNAQVGPNLDSMPPADISIATQWHTAYMVANFPATRRRFYLIQDFEPLFYPAGTNYALAEESYRLGLYGICNTERMLSLYRERYGGQGTAFMPAVDRSVFHAEGRRGADDGEPVTIFIYARPGHWRNCWELASLALGKVKQRLGDRVRIITAGSWARPDDLGRGIEHLGLLDYRETGQLYRNCDLGLALTVSEHPSYLPLELLACGTPVVAFDNRAGYWILRHEQNSLLCPRTVDGLVEGIERMATDDELRERLSKQGLADIAARHGDWDAAFEGIYEYLCDPAGAGRPADAAPAGQ
jgi:GT2 family glycosyltransferase/glycosyltransferase involved in cell wall biosynthesis